MSNSFQNKKDLRFVITLGTGTFGSSSNNVIILQGFRATANISKAGGSMMGELRAQIYGVSQADMNSITTLQWKPKSVIKNTVVVYAIDGDQESVVFSGNIVNAWGDYTNQPNVFLMIQAQTAYVNLLTPVSPSTYQGPIDVASVMQQLAQLMGYSFENNSVNVTLGDTYLPGTGLDQVKSLAAAAGIDVYLDDDILAITPPNTPRHSIMPTISKDTGLKGYPNFDGIGVSFETDFNPSITFGGLVDLQTELPNAKGQWIVTSVAHNLSSQVPGGPWFSKVRGSLSGIAYTG